MSPRIGYGVTFDKSKKHNIAEDDNAYNMMFLNHFRYQDFL